MKRLLLALVIVTVMSVSSAYAFSGWQMYNFGNEAFDHNNNWSPVTYPNGVGDLPSPGNLGEGGEGFDLEGFHFAQVGNTVNLALVNSFGYTAHSSGWNQNYNLGDIFFGFDGQKYQYGIDVSRGRLYEVNSWRGIPNQPGTYYGTPIAQQVGAWEISAGNWIGNVNNTKKLWQGLETNPMQGNGDTYVWEFSFDVSQISKFSDYQTISFHNTLACGNDLIEESYDAVPEPATMLLFGVGLLGAGVYRRIRRS
jgi:hypothetical protein